MASRRHLGTEASVPEELLGRAVWIVALISICVSGHRHIGEGQWEWEERSEDRGARIKQKPFPKLSSPRPVSGRCAPDPRTSAPETRSRCAFRVTKRIEASRFGSLFSRVITKCCGLFRVVSGRWRRKKEEPAELIRGSCSV